GLARIYATGNRDVNRLDVESLPFHQKVHEGYLLLVEHYPERIRIVNADQFIDSVVEDVWSLVLDAIQ
uniref:dTMP kinase n=1 Tax=Lysinibacillus sp. D4A3_S15 TaxID=2941227 RepID=UPI0037C77893